MRAVALSAAAVLLLCGSAAALDRELNATIHDFAQTPLTVKRSSVKLIQTYSTPSQTASPESADRKNRVRYANRAGLLYSAYMLTGELMCANTAGQSIEAVGLTIIPLDAFHQPVEHVAEQEYPVQQIVASIPAGATRKIEWEQPVRSPDIYEVAVLVTRIRFADGSVWFAPVDELVGLYQP